MTKELQIEEIQTRDFSGWIVEIDCMGIAERGIVKRVVASAWDMRGKSHQIRLYLENSEIKHPTKGWTSVIQADCMGEVHPMCFERKFIYFFKEEKGCLVFSYINGNFNKKVRIKPA